VLVVLFDLIFLFANQLQSDKGNKAFDLTICVAGRGHSVEQSRNG